MTSFSSVPLIAGAIAGALAAAALFWEPQTPPTAVEQAHSSDLLTEEMAAEIWDQQYVPEAAAEGLDPIPVKLAKAINIEFVSETGYYNQQSHYVIDLLELDYAYLSVRLFTPEGHPVEGAEPRFSIDGSSRLLQPDEVSSMSNTDENGSIDFAVVGGKMGVDRVTVKVGDTQADILVNVISLRAAGLPQLATIEGGIPWEELTRARIRFDDLLIEAQFPATVAAKSGKTVKLTGYMMPLETDILQHRFLLTANPPSCFFHIPGGPAGAVEVLTETGVEVTWDPVVLEGRFETLEHSDAGLVYRLHDARVLQQ